MSWLDEILTSLRLVFVSVTSWSVTVFGNTFAQNAASLVFQDVTSPVTVTAQRGGGAGCPKPDWQFDRTFIVTKEDPALFPLGNLTAYTHYRLMDGNTEKLRAHTAPS